MTRDEFVEFCAGGFGEGMCCSEIIVTAGGEQLRVSSPVIPHAASGFCGGISYEKQICGALSGAVMVLGIAAGLNRLSGGKARAVADVKRLLGLFRAQFGSVNCYGLTGLDLNDPAQLARLDREQCRAFVAFTAGALHDLLDAEEGRGC